MRRTIHIICIVSVLFALCKNAVAQGNQTLKTGTATTPVTFPGTGCFYSWVNDTPGIGLAASGAGNISSFTAVNTGASPVTATVTATLVPPAAYIANAGDNTVSVISTADQKVIAAIQLNSSPICVSVSPDGSRVYAAVDGNNSGGVAVINTATNAVVTTIPITYYPNNVLVSPDGTKVYVTNDHNLLNVISTATNTVVGSLTLNSPSALAISPDGSILYATSEVDNDVYVINTTTNKVITTIPVGSDPISAAITPDGTKLYVTSYDSGNITVINTATNSAAAAVSLDGTALFMSMSPDGSVLYAGGFSSSAGNCVFIISTATNALIYTLADGSSPYGVCVTPDGTQLYAANANNNTVTVFDTKTYATLANIKVGMGPNSHGNFITGGSGCSGAPLKYTITVNPAATTPPAITKSSATGGIFACEGTASVSPDIQQFTVAGSNLNGNITATAPVGFLVSLSQGSGYANNITIPETGGSAGNTTVYVSSSATAPLGSISGNVTLTSPGTGSQNVAVTGSVNALPGVNGVSPQTVGNGDNTAAVNFTGTGNQYTWTNDTPGIGLAASGVGDIASFTAVNAGSTPVTATITAVPQKIGYVYLSNSGLNNVSVISTLTNTVVDNITVGEGPAALATSPDGTRVYVANGFNISVINTASNTVTATINTTSGIVYLYVSPDNSRLYMVTDAEPQSIWIFNTATDALIKTIPLTTFSAPGYLTISANGNFIYIVNEAGSVTVINSTTYQTVATIPVGASPYYITINPSGSLIYVANSNSNSVSVINTVTNIVVATIPVGISPQALVVSPDGSTLYVANKGSNTVSVINTATNMVVATIPTSSGASGILISSDGSEVYLDMSSTNTVLVINTATNTVTSTISGFSRPFSSGNSVTPGSDCPGPPVTFTITVNPSPAIPPAIIAGSATGAITACEGTASVAPNIQQFTVSGSSLTGDITAAASTGFEISLNSSIGFANSVTISQSTGTVANATLYVRSSATAAAGPLPGSVTITSPGAATQQVTVTGFVNALPVVDPVPSQTVDGGVTTAAVAFAGTGNLFTWVNDLPAIGLAASGTGDIAPFIAFNTGNTPLTATITVMPASSTTGYAYIPDSGVPGSVSVVSTTQNSVVENITVGSAPDCVAVNPDGSMVYVGNSFSNNVSVISTATNTVIATIAVGKNPESICVSPDGSKVYVANFNDGTVSVISTASNVVTATDGGFQQPRALAISPDGSTLYVCGASEISVVGTAANNVEAAIPASPYEIAISPDGSRLYTTNIDGGIMVYNTLTNSFVTSIAVGLTPEGLAVSPDGSILYVACFNAGNVTAIDTKTNTVINTIAVPGGPLTLSVSPDGKSVFVEDNSSSQLSVINAVTNKVVSTIPVGKNPLSFGNFLAAGTGCPGSPVTFTITVNPLQIGAIVIPNTFTPNGDGVNDTWDIKHLSLYPQCSVQIFTRWGKNVYTSIGYGIPWNGTYGGSPLPEGTYYYVINLNNNTQPLAGFVAIIR